MPVPIPFTKMSGAGNDFVVINNVTDWLKADPAELAQVACSRRFGIGADGLLLVEPSRRADFTMRYFNADGSYGGMCGNGGRCIARFSAEKGISGRTLSFESLDYLYRAEVYDAYVALKMKPVIYKDLKRLELRSIIDSTVYFVHTGSPHAVLKVPSLQELNVAELGRAVRYHPSFQPEGCNVNFLELNPATQSVKIRTYERGVEAETLACGTGAVASAVIAAVLHGYKSPIDVFVRSGERLRVHLSEWHNDCFEVVLEGSAYSLFEGTFQYDEQARTISGVPKPQMIEAL